MHDDAEFIAQTRGRRETYALLARLLREEISLNLLQQLRAMRGKLHDSEDAGQGHILLNRYLSGIERIEDEQVIGELAADFAGLFLNAGSRPAHPYESFYTSPEHLLMQEARDQVLLAYTTSGLALGGKFHEPEDHIALELEFMSYLCQRTVAASEAGDPQMTRTHLQSQREFLEDHLLRWAPRFCEDLECHAATDFYRALGRLLSDFLDLERETMAEWSS
jgi:anaerobic sulfite reductase subunit A